MRNSTKQLLCGILCFVMLFGLIPAFSPSAEAASQVYNGYTTLAMIYDQGDCYSMQGFGIYGNYLYSIKINGDTNASAVIAKTHKDTGSTAYMTNSLSGGKYFDFLGHANDLDMANVAGSATMFVTTTVPGSYSLVRLVMSGTTLTKVGNYNVTLNGTQVSFGGVNVLHVDSEYVTLLFKSGRTFYIGKVGVNQTSGTITASAKFTIDISDINFGGVSKDLSSFVHQGFEYHDNKVYVPLTGNHAVETINVSGIAVYDMEGASGTIKNNPDYSFWFESTDFPGLFEIESLGINPYDGKLYFNTNSRKSSSSTNYDAVHVVKNFVYQPDMRPSKVENYRWEVIDDVLTPVTTGGNSYNGLIMHGGSIKDGTMTGGRYCLSEPIVLNHDRRWIVEWKSSGACNHNMLLSTEGSSNVANHPYLFRTTNNDMIALGYLDDSSKNQNFGIKLSDYGIDGTAEHVYRLNNTLYADGSNMVYLSVDGVRLGALNNHYVGLTSQNTTSDWVSGKDFIFSYFGTNEYGISNCSVSYIQVWGNDGLKHQVDEPDIYRWETQNNALTAVSDACLTVNTPTVMHGTCTNGVYSGSQFKLSRDVALIHDRPWVVEWQSEGNFSGGAMLLAAHERSSAFNAPFLFRYTGSSLLAFGSFSGSQHNNYGVNLADLGIDGTAPHVYRLTNKISSDGSNMVYLSVDGAEVSAMNNYFVGLTSQNTTSNWISGKDFTFTYMGTYQNKINDGSIGYFQIWENGIPADHIPSNYRWEFKDNAMTSITTGGFEENNITHIFGSISGNTITSSSFRMEKSVVLCHDKPWSIQWTSEGFSGTGNSADMILASSNYNNEPNSTYVLRTRDGNMLAIGTRSGSHHNYGLKLSNYGIDPSVAHSYALRNRVNADGSNMVYLFVDGKEVGPMNGHFVGVNYQNETSDWLSGKDLTFTYMGSYNYLIQNDTVSYIQINEDCAHSFSDWTVTDPTCIAEGSKTRTCSQCGHVETEVIPTTDEHSFSGWSVKDPGCTTDGEKTRSCIHCGETETEVIPAVGHSWKDGNCSVCGEICPHSAYENGICTECGMAEPVVNYDYYLFGYINGANYACEADFMNMGQYKFVDGKLTATFTETCYVGVKAEGNAAWYLTDGWLGEVNSATLYNSSVVGTNADKLYVPGGVEVTFTLVNNGDGTLSLSYTTKELPKPDPVITLKYPTLSFEGEVFYNVYFTTENLDAAVEDMGLLTWYNRPANTTAATYETAEAIIPGAVYNADADTYMVRSQGVPAKLLGDNMYLRVYAKLSDGSYAYSSVTYYSAKFYAADILKKSTNSDMKALCVAMLNYGAAAQVHFNHNADNLMNADLTAAHKALAKEYSPDMISTVVSPDAAKTVYFKSNGGFANGYPSVSFDGAFSINYYLKPAKAVESEMVLYCWNLDTYNSVSALTEANATDKVVMAPASNPAEYFGNYTGIAAKQIDETVFVAGVYTSGGVRYSSPVMCYSLSAYCADQIVNGSATMQDFAKATVVYGDAAKTYFANLNG